MMICPASRASSRALLAVTPEGKVRVGSVLSAVRQARDGRLDTGVGVRLLAVSSRAT